MSRLFLTLFLLMLLVVIGFGMNINGVAKYLFNGTLEALRRQQMGGVISLLENEIRGLDAPQRQQRLTDIQAMFRYEVSLLPIDEMELSASEQQRLRNGEFVNRSHDQAEFSYHPAHLPGMAWRLQLDYTLSEGDRDFLVGAGVGGKTAGCRATCAMVGSRGRQCPTFRYSYPVTDRAGGAGKPVAG